MVDMLEYREISVECKPVVASNGPLPPKMQSRMKSHTKEYDMFGLSEMIHENSNDYASIPFSLSRKVVEKAKQEMKKIDFYFEENSVAKLHLRELELGPLLGSGGFSDVFEITQIKPCRQVDSMLRSDESKLRSRLVTSFSDNVSFMWCPYAVKTLRRQLVKDPKKFASGAVDLLLEGAYLTALEHPNILKLHGISADGPEGFYDGRHDSYFLIVDRLTETLEDRIVRWRKMEKKLSIPWCRRMDRKDRKIKLFMIERLKVAADIASAVTYMHSKRIIYRDIKPENIGFDIENKVKVFDFGLCGKLPEGKDGGFHVVHALPGGIGTYGYMSPEIAENKPYNQATDVFSFGMVLFEILSLNRPVLLKGQKTVNTTDIRLCDQWPESLRKSLLQSWSSVISERPTMDAFLDVIRDTISKLESDINPCAKTRKLFANN